MQNLWYKLHDFIFFHAYSHDDDNDMMAIMTWEKERPKERQKEEPHQGLCTWP